MTAEYAEESTARAVDINNATFPAAYDEKDDSNALRARLAARKKPIYAGLAFICLVIVGVSVGVTAGASSSASTSSSDTNTAGSGSTALGASDISASTIAGTVATGGSGSTATDVVTYSSTKGSQGSSSSASSSSKYSAGSVAGEAEYTTSNSTSATGSAAASASASKAASASKSASKSASSSGSGEVLGYTAVDFDWTDSSNWQYASGSAVDSSMFSGDSITLTPDTSSEPIRTLTGWSGEKIVLIEWTRSSTSDTNIWMLNTAIADQFATNNGWPYYGELDIFEMFTQDAVTYPSYDYSGFVDYTSVSSYGQLTMHMGPRTEDGNPCYCSASASKSVWYDSTKPMVTSCGAQFANNAQDSIATVFGSDSTGQYIQLIQNPTVTKGAKKDGSVTYDITAGSDSVSTSKIYNNANLFWGVDASDSCASGGGHNAETGFPFFEEFRIVLEEQKKDDSSAYFEVTNIQVFTPN